jgi:hypothetical protein
MRWSENVPRWAGIVFGMFGILCIVGGVSPVFSRGSLDGLAPALVVGGGWAVFGFKRGFPIIPTGDGTLASGLGSLRRRIVVMYAFPVLWAPVVIVVMTNLPERASDAAFVPVVLPMFFAVFYAGFSQCPRCGKHFFIHERLRLLPKHSFFRCQNCGGGLRSDDAPPAV